VGLRVRPPTTPPALGPLRMSLLACFLDYVEAGGSTAVDIYAAPQRPVIRKLSTLNSDKHASSACGYEPARRQPE